MTAGEGTPKRARFSFDRAMSGFADVTNSPRRARRSAKCLFGAPDRDETQRLVAEQYARDRRRYIRRFDFDIDTEAPFAGDRSPPCRSAAETLAVLTGPELNLPGTPRRRTPRTPKSPRTPRTPRTPRSAARSPRMSSTRRQLQMTDYWTIRKCSDTSPSDKEN